MTDSVMGPTHPSHTPPHTITYPQGHHFYPGPLFFIRGGVFFSRQGDFLSPYNPLKSLRTLWIFRQWRTLENMTDLIKQDPY